MGESLGVLQPLDTRINRDAVTHLSGRHDTQRSRHVDGKYSHHAASAFSRAHSRVYKFMVNLYIYGGIKMKTDIRFALYRRYMNYDPYRVIL